MIAAIVILLAVAASPAGAAIPVATSSEVGSSSFYNLIALTYSLAE